jgi:outer membrane protein assembly factor BamE (lipoprotein component of BamABCDE complex)
VKNRMLCRKILGKGVFGAILIASWFGCSRLTQENFAKIHAGMTESEVKAILGEPAEVHSAEAFGMGAKTYVYNQGNSKAEIIFVNGKVWVTQGSLQ